jgi:hypothetical protein
MPNLYNTGGQFSGGFQNPNYGGTAGTQWPNPWGPASSYIPAGMNDTWARYQNMYGNSNQSMGGGAFMHGPGSSASIQPWGRGLINQGTGYNPNIQSGTSGVDPMQVINAQMPAIQEQMQRNFAGAGSRFGAAGMLASGGTGSGYAASLGDQSRKASTDVASLYWQVMNDASQRQADRDQQSKLAQAEQELSMAKMRADTGMGLGGMDSEAQRSMWEWMLSQGNNQNQTQELSEWEREQQRRRSGNNQYQYGQGQQGQQGNQYYYGPHAPTGWQNSPSYMPQGIDQGANQAYWESPYRRGW